MKKDKGIALITVLILFVLILALGVIMLNIVQKATKVTFSTVKYETAMEAASSGIDAGISKVLTSTNEGKDPEGNFTVTLGNFKVNVTVEKILVGRAKGTAIEFAGGYQGLGKGAGQVFAFYLITSQARGKNGEIFTIETNFKQILKAF